VHCRDHAVQLHRAREEFTGAGVRLVLIGQANPRHAAHFRRKLGIELPVLADEERTTYRLAGLRRANAGQLIGPKSAISALAHGARSGVVQGRTVGDIAQLGGAMVVATDGTVLWSQASSHAGDTIDPDALLEVARGT
jgi:hypothetical protein